MKVVAVLDHALIRWLERVHGIDLTFARDEIAKTVQSAVNLGARNYSLDGMTYVLDGPKVVTIVPSRSGSSSRKNVSKFKGYSQRVQR